METLQFQVWKPYLDLRTLLYSEGEIEELKIEKMKTLKMIISEIEKLEIEKGTFLYCKRYKSCKLELPLTTFRPVCFSINFNYSTLQF